MQLQHYFWVLRHWLSLILLGVCLCTATTFAVSFLFRPDYQGIALIQVNGSPTSTTNDVYSNQALAVADSLLITSTDVLRAASQKVPGTSLDELITAVSAAPKDGTAVIEVRAHSRNAQHAADMANAVTDMFLQMQITSATANLNAYAHELTLDVDAAKNNLQTAQQQLLVLQQSKASPDAIQKQQNQVNWYQASYNTLLATYRQTQLQLLQADTLLTVAQRALPPSTSVLPRLLLNSVLAAGISLLLMLTLAIVLDWLDTTLKTPHDVQQLAKLTPLGSMPQCSHPLRLPTAQKTVPTHDIAVEQALIIIGASFKRLYRDQKIVLVTSLRSGEGVTTTVSNLALLLAQSGTRVLIVDANQRRPGLSELFDLSQSTCSAAGTAIDPALQMPASWPEKWSTPIANLWCMPVSADTGALSQPLAANALGKLLRSLVQQAATTAVDIILLDAPALEEDARALALASIADGTLLVVAAGQTRGERVRQAQAVLQRLGAPLGSVLINRQKVTHRSYFYTMHENSELVEIESLATLPAGVSKSARPTVVRSETAFDHSEAAQKQAQVVTVQPSNNGLEIIK